MTPQSVFGNLVPSAVDVGNGYDQINLGHVFKVAQAGSIVGVRHYEGSGTNNGTPARIGALWDINGNLLASKAFPASNVPATQQKWREVNFDTPISIQANTPYVISVLVNTGNWSATFNDLMTDKVVGDITLYGYLNDPASIGQGRYFESASLIFPTSASGGHSSYGVDLLFEVGTTEVPISGTASVSVGVYGSITRNVSISGLSAVSYGVSGSPKIQRFIAGSCAMAVSVTGRITRYDPNNVIPDTQGRYIKAETRGITVKAEVRGVYK